MNKESLQKLITLCLTKQLNFVVFSIPNSHNFEIIIENHLICNHTQSHFIFHPFEVSKDYPVIKVSSDYRITDSLIDDEFIDMIDKIPSVHATVNKAPIYAEPKENYLVSLQKEIDQLSTSNLNKFIYSRVKSIENTHKIDLSTYITTLNEQQESAFTYLLNHHKAGTWIGASPETLLNWKGKSISTMSLAGTQPNNGELPQWTSKEADEQEYVTNYIEKAFQHSQIAYKKGKVETVQAGPVFHLKH